MTPERVDSTPAHWETFYMTACIDCMKVMWPLITIILLCCLLWFCFKASLVYDPKNIGKANINLIKYMHSYGYGTLSIHNMLLLVYHQLNCKRPKCNLAAINWMIDSLKKASDVTMVTDFASHLTTCSSITADVVPCAHAWERSGFLGNRDNCYDRSFHPPPIRFGFIASSDLLPLFQSFSSFYTRVGWKVSRLTNGVGPQQRNLSCIKFNLSWY